MGDFGDSGTNQRIDSSLFSMPFKFMVVASHGEALRTSVAALVFVLCIAVLSSFRVSFHLIASANNTTPTNAV